ncbi:MAG: iron-sulfur cluster carrier protein ApbC [Gammaproteobacteria bacterium]|jgi:ATP-binding protein involved in chromosome partitioning|nr:iron-sulfur cluster carrier protein ApbC [Gammaproteobacteria bacterium]MBP6481233.1 iron-sulfur cluster carrier protein ApbC [Pseudomonadales bacterium]MBP7911708.1 iron-sulfur cluster carrier protein ApbC [Pseudomonadales bacterium]
MNAIDLQAARRALASCRVDGIEAPLGEWAELAALERRGDIVIATVHAGIPAAGLREPLAAVVRHALAPLVAGATLRMDFEVRIAPTPRRGDAPGLDSVRNLIAVASGKGGVGKSTTAVNLALALQREGARVGLLDADIYGPSQQIMLGVPEQQRPEGREGNFIVPIEAHGLQTMSMGYLVTEKTAMVWRGPMASSALQQMITQTLWRDLDYLVVDMPPGTGDIQLTLAQKAPVSGAVIVTTPQDIALLDCKKGIEMFAKVGIPVLGVVENMAVHVCSHCGHAEHLFGAGGGERVAREYGVPLLGALPLDIRIREQTDGGKPTVVADPDGPLGAIYRDVARRMGLELLRRNASQGQVPSITVTND